MRKATTSSLNLSLMMAKRYEERSVNFAPSQSEGVTVCNDCLLTRPGRVDDDADDDVDVDAVDDEGGGGRRFEPVAVVDTGAEEVADEDEDEGGGGLVAAPPV